MELGLTGRIALVAAASRGLGKAVALRLAREGAVVAVCSRSADAISAAADDIAQATGARTLGLVCDVRDESAVDAMVDRVVDELGGLHVLVPNAGGPPAGLAKDFTTADYRAAAELNLFSTITMVNRALPTMQAQGWGRIVAITSIAARQPVPNLILSNTARAGLTGFLKTLSAQVAANGITVNSVCPGFTDTERVQELAANFAASGQGSEEEFYGQVARDIPLARMVRPEEFASAVAFLASEHAAAITGVALPIDGGMSKALF